jgi:hypothetical protein
VKVVMNVQKNFLETCRDLAGYCCQPLDQVLVLTVNNRPIWPGTVDALDQLGGRALLVPANTVQFDPDGFIEMFKLRQAYIILDQERDSSYELIALDIYNALKAGQMLRRRAFGIFDQERHK